MCRWCETFVKESLLNKIWPLKKQIHVICKYYIYILFDNICQTIHYKFFTSAIQNPVLVEHIKSQKTCMTLSPKQCGSLHTGLGPLMTPDLFKTTSFLRMKQMAWPKQYLIWIKYGDWEGEFIVTLYFVIINNDDLTFISILSDIYIYEITAHCIYMVHNYWWLTIDSPIR